MKLSDIMSNMGLELYPQLALILFLIVFALICARLFLFTPRGELERAARIPLWDDEANSKRRLEHTGEKQP